MLLVDRLLDQGLPLDNLCVYDQIIKSETSFHCSICNKCVDSFDHHCPFINNCLGKRNHKYFLLFIFTYTLFIITILTETLRHFIEIYREKGFSCIYTDEWTTILLILIILHLPVVLYQSFSQIKSLCRPPRKSKFENLQRQLNQTSIVNDTNASRQQISRSLLERHMNSDDLSVASINEKKKCAFWINLQRICCGNRLSQKQLYEFLFEMNNLEKSGHRTTATNTTTS